MGDGEPEGASDGVAKQQAGIRGTLCAALAVTP
jgi:hypothetical protein